MPVENGDRDPALCTPWISSKALLGRKPLSGCQVRGAVVPEFPESFLPCPSDPGTDTLVCVFVFMWVPVCTCVWQGRWGAVLGKLVFEQKPCDETNMLAITS